MSDEAKNKPQTPAPAKGFVLDKELEEYRNLLQTPTEFKEGFTWVTVAGALFCGLLMFPGAIYLGLLSGMGMNAAATWVTVIVFSEITRRALRSMSKEEMVILLTVSSAMMVGGPFGDLIYRQFLLQSDAVKEAGLFGQFPSWWAPMPDSAALTKRTFMHSDWLVPIGFVVFMTIIGFVQTYTLGYGIFRLTSDVEKLPFPMAPVGAQGVMALAEEDTGKGAKKSERWTVFSIGTVVGLAFGVISVGVPALSSAFLEKPIMILPIPWFDLCRVTEKIMPATPTGVIFDLGLVLMGMVFPFWAVVGSSSSVLITFLLNPVLFQTGVLSTWRPGMDTINTQISNNIDFYFSAGLGVAFGIAACSVYQTIRQVRTSLRNLKTQQAARKGAPTGSIWTPPPGRGDWSLKLCLVGYVLAAAAVVTVAKILVPQFNIVFLIAFAFVYVPLTSYLDARIMGIAGTYIAIPFVREAFILFSGVKGVTPWLVPLPTDSFGGMSNWMRQTELTGVRFPSLIKAWLLTTPLLFVFSFVFWSFLWKDAPIPCDMYPYAQKMWDLQARNTMIMWSATTNTTGAQTLFQRSMHPEFLAAGFAFSTVMFTALSAFNLPTMLVYGMARGLGSIPHGLLMELFGACLGRFYFQRKFGRQRFLRAAPILLAGYAVGTGLVGMAAVAVRLIASAITSTPL